MNRSVFQLPLLLLIFLDVLSTDHYRMLKDDQNLFFYKIRVILNKMTKIISWNVNGIRASVKKGLWNYMKKDGADIFCFQETSVYLNLLT